jgi:hypothetical protein
MGAERLCDHCSGPLPAGSRADRRFCTDSCRVGAYKRRQRRAHVELLTNVRAAPEPAAPAVPDQAAQLERLRALVDDAIIEPRLLGVIATEARQGSWRAAAWLLQHVVWAADRPGGEEPIDELTAWRQFREANR